MGGLTAQISAQGGAHPRQIVGMHPTKRRDAGGARQRAAGLEGGAATVKHQGVAAHIPFPQSLMSAFQGRVQTLFAGT